MFCFAGFLLYFLNSLSPPVSFLTSTLPALTSTPRRGLRGAELPGGIQPPLIPSEIHEQDESGAVLHNSSQETGDMFEIHPKGYTPTSPEPSEGSHTTGLAQEGHLSPSHSCPTTAAAQKPLKSTCISAQRVHPWALGWSDPRVCVLSVR